MDNPYGTYREIRAQRTWRPLGKMSWWRVILGLGLLLLVFLISGFFSQRLAVSGHFRAADRLLVYPIWVERYRPELKAFIEAGVLFEDGDYEAAREAFAVLEDTEAGMRMVSICDVKRALQESRDGDPETARTILDGVDTSLLPDEVLQEYRSLQRELSP